MKTIKLSLIVFAFTLFSASTYAQPGNADISISGNVVLSVDQPLQSSYELDAAPFNFSDDAEAIEYFKTVNSREVQFRPILQNDVVMMYLQLKLHPEWTKADWTTYLNDLKVIKTKKESEAILTN